MFKKINMSKKSAIWLSALLIVKMVIGLVAISLSFNNLPVSAQQTADLPAIAFSQTASGLERPVQVTHAGDSSGRLFIVEQPGRIRILKDGSLLSTPFLDIQDRVLSPASGGGNEEGLLSVAFPDDFYDQGYFFVYYTTLDGDNRVARFSVGNEMNLADPDSEILIIHLPHPTYINHNGGQLAFGPDGYLYIGTGDGGGGGDPLRNGQNPNSLNGKILRIDVRTMASSSVNGDNNYYLSRICKKGDSTAGFYRVPDDNPFIGNDNFRPEIWALGLRNPWWFSFDRATGDLFIGDVGQNRWEEINFQTADSLGGENYGWNIMEGKECYQSASCNTSGLTMPVHVYPIFSSTNCSVTGGFVYRGEEINGLQGIYVFGDFCSGNIWGLENTGSGWESGLLASPSYRISAFGEDQAGELYLADLSGGSIYQIVPQIDQP